MAKSETKNTKAEKANKSVADWSKLSLRDLRSEYEKLKMDIKLGRENNTSLVRKLKVVIAREMTKLNKKN
jgi:ribosomal protein L29